MTDLETMLAVAGNSGDPTARLALADALEEAGDADTAERERALAKVLAKHPSTFATITVARDWWEDAPENRYRVFLVADGQCLTLGPTGLTPAATSPMFWPGPAGEMWFVREGAWCHGYGCIIFDPDEPEAGVEHLDFIGDSPDDVVRGLNEFPIQAGRHVLAYLTGQPSRETHWFRCDGERWEEIAPPEDLPPELLTGEYC